jgi:hypothetical protein
VFQRGYNDAKRLYKERGLRKDKRSTLGWSVEDERNYVNKLEIARESQMFWIGDNR